VRGVCVDLPQFDYGSRSSMVLFVGEQSKIWWAEGRPDRTPFIEHPEWLQGFTP
jgi:hypothetical protein